MKTLLLIPSYEKTKLDADVAADRHPTMDYHALVTALRRESLEDPELIDYGDVDREQHPAVKFVRKFAGRGPALALMGFLRRDTCDAIFTNAENVALPLALLLSTVTKRPRHVTIAHRLTAKKKQPMYRHLKLFRQMDVIFVYSSAQRTFACQELGIPEDIVRLIPFHVDHRFYRPLADGRAQSEGMCSAGLEWRDYPTLLDAVADETDLNVTLAAASPWSKHKSELEGRQLPPHVRAGRYEYGDLRSLYAKSSFVAVPLYENDFQAGVTTILEAMAMGKPVIVTNTSGQTDVIAHEQNGLYVAPGNAEAWKEAIARLRNDEMLRARLGRAARRWVEENATLDRWVENILSGLREPVPAAAGGTQAPSTLHSRLAT